MISEINYHNRKYLSKPFLHQTIIKIINKIIRNKNDKKKKKYR